MAEKIVGGVVLLDAILYVLRSGCAWRLVGIKLLLEPARTGLFERLSHLWLDAAYTGEERSTGATSLAPASFTTLTRRTVSSRLLAAQKG